MFFLNYQNQTMFDLKNRMARLSDLGKPREEFLYASIQNFQRGPRRAEMLLGQKYYVNENDITERVRYYIDRKGVKQEVTNLANSQLSHPFMRKLTNQKVNYLLSKDFSVVCEDDTFKALLEKQYFTKRFKKMLKNLGKDAIVNGIAWLQTYYDEMGALQFKRIPSEEVIPFWADAEHTVLEGLVRYYTIIRYKPDSTTEEIVKVESYTTKGIWHFVQGSKGLEPDTDYEEILTGHFVANQQVQTPEGQTVEQAVQAVWNRIPFVGFKYNADELSLIKWVKPLIDDYDLNTSDTSNNLQDVPNSIKVVKNYDGTDKGEFVQNLATFRTAFVSGDGDMTAVETKLDIAAIDSHLNRLRKDIYEAGNGVDTQVEELGNASGVALKFRYADLDIDSEGLSNEFRDSLDQLLWFIKTDILNRGGGDYMNTEVEIVFNTDSIINESEVIQDVKNSVGIISDETTLTNHPWVTDVKDEMKKVKKQKAEAIAEAQEEMNAGFGTTAGVNTQTEE